MTAPTEDKVHERMSWLLETVVPQITAEEWQQLHAGTLGENDEEALAKCAGVKEKYGINAEELKSLRYYNN